MSRKHDLWLPASRHVGRADQGKKEIEEKKSAAAGVTSDVGAIQQRLQVADLHQQSSLGQEELLLCKQQWIST